MSSRLSSLLVRDGLVGVKRMEKAYQRQVIYGGSLDTTLLEMGLVSEDRLTQYLALASGLPPATRTECNVFDAEAVKLCNEHDAVRYRVVPLSLEDGSLRALVHDPVDMGLLEELADRLDVPVQPLIVPEYRWHMVFTRNYGGQTTARFSTLARAADASPITSPVGRARTVIVDGEEHQVVDVRSPIVRAVGPEHATMRMHVPEPGGGGAGAAVGGPPPATGRPVPVDLSATGAATATQTGRTPTPGALTASANLAMERTGERRVTRQVPVAPPPPRPGTMELEAEEAAPNEPAPPTITGRSRTGEMSAQSVAQHYASVESQRLAAVERRASTATIRESGRDSGPISGPTSTSDGVPTRPLASGNTPIGAPPVPDVPDDGSALLVPTARALMAAATDRDKVFMILLRALRSKAKWAGLLTVQGGAAIGRIALAEDGLDTSAMPSVLIPLDTTSPFQSTTHARHPYVGPVASGNTDIDVMIARMGGTVPPTALLLPILLRDRCIALAVAHRMNEPVSLAEVTELLPMAAATADALGRLIVRSKSVGYRVPTASDAAVPAVDADDVLTKKVQKKAAEWKVPTAPAADNPADVPAAIATAGSITVAATSRPVADVLDAIEGDDDDKAEAALADAVSRPEEVVPLLPARFPGRLRVDRYQVSGRALRPGQYGGLLELVVRLGAPVSELLLEKMGDSRRDVRFYATVCAAAIRPRSAVYALVERLFDADYGVRGAAVEALAGYPLRDLDLAMVRCRHALHSEDLERVAASSQAIAELSDVAAIPDLIDVVGRESKRADLARRSLVSLTRSDFGTSERKWRKWWEEHKERHRIEWLIDALGQKDVALRGAAAEDLRRLTGEFFGFDPGHGRREREDAHKRWAQWWNQTGRKRFVRDDDERVRPTAVLPVTTRRD